MDIRFFQISVIRPSIKISIKCTARLDIPDNRLLKEMDRDLKRMNISIRDKMDIRPFQISVIRPLIKISIRLYIK